MQIAIVGAGLAGLASAWTLLKSKIHSHPIQVTLLDEAGIGAGASGVAAGLMHPYANIHSKLNREGDEGYESCMELLNAAEQALGYRPYDASGILRPALSAVQEQEFLEASQKYPKDIIWKDSTGMEALVPRIVRAPGILIKNGITVYIDEYLNGLWLACQHLGATFQRRAVRSMEELNEFDLIVIAMGRACNSLPELSTLPLNYTKGQLLELAWPKELPPLPLAFNGKVYCVMLRDQKRCLVGATYEKIFASAEPDMETAKKIILPKLGELYPPLRDAEIIGCRAGVRVSTPRHLPIIQKINAHCYVMTGFGSKGLLYHGLYSRKLVSLINESFPRES